MQAHSSSHARSHSLSLSFFTVSEGWNQSLQLKLHSLKRKPLLFDLPQSLIQGSTKIHHKLYLRKACQLFLAPIKRQDDELSLTWGNYQAYSSCPIKRGHKTHYNQHLAVFGRRTSSFKGPGPFAEGQGLLSQGHPTPWSFEAQRELAFPANTDQFSHVT